jgi:lysophospholipase L1-like esterase
MIVMACPPFRWSVDTALLILFAMRYISANTRFFSGAFRFPITFALAILLVFCFGSEFLHRRLPTIHGTKAKHLVIIGDSISAGLFSDVAWPTLLQNLTSTQVSNLAQVGATTAGAIQTAAKVAPDNSLVLIEVGGNDLLSGTSSEQFSRSLETLIRRLVASGRTLVMFELPLIPDRIAYGQIQRRLAAKYGIYLIPKRYFVRVISGAEATSDGVHLSRTGAQRMARLVAEVLSEVLKPPSTSKDGGLGGISHSFNVFQLNSCEIQRDWLLYTCSGDAA